MDYYVVDRVSAHSKFPYLLISENQFMFFDCAFKRFIIRVSISIISPLSQCYSPCHSFLGWDAYSEKLIVMPYTYQVTEHRFEKKKCH